MEVLTVSEASERLYRLLDEVSSSGGAPVLITGKRGSAVLVSEDDWRAIEETLHLLSIPGMWESIREGMATSPAECANEPGW
jgi:prevent-host-death family protein